MFHLYLVCLTLFYFENFQLPTFDKKTNFAKDLDASRFKVTFLFITFNLLFP